MNANRHVGGQGGVSPGGPANRCVSSRQLDHLWGFWGWGGGMNHNINPSHHHDANPLPHPQGGGHHIPPAQLGGASPVGGLGSHLKRWFLSMSGNPQGFPFCFCEITWLWVPMAGSRNCGGCVGWTPPTLFGEPPLTHPLPPPAHEGGE